MERSIMARRQRRRIARPKPPNLGVILFQILILIGFLVAILSVTDTIGDGTGAIFESLTADDIQVSEESDEEDSSFPGGATDDLPDEDETTDEPAPDEAESHGGDERLTDSDADEEVGE
jgi:hypothetical protein